MKSMIFSAAGLSLGGAAFMGLSDGPDFERAVARPPLSVYTAFSALAPEGVVTRHENHDGTGRTVTLRTSKRLSESIHYEIAFDDRPVVDVELTFEGEAEGKSTRVTAELDIDAYELGSRFETEAGVALSMVPDSLIDVQFAQFMDDLVDDVEAGRPLPPLGLNSAGVRRQRASADVRERRADAARDRRAAVRPMARPTPMVDPNKVARTHRETGNGQSEYWGR